MNTTNYPYDNETPTQSGRLVVDYRMMWGIPAGVVAVVGFFVLVNLGHPGLAFSWAFLVVAFYFLTVYARVLDGFETSPLTKGTKIGMDAFFNFSGWLTHARQAADLGSVTSEDGKDVVLKASRPPKLIGKIDVVGYRRRAGGDEEVGVMQDANLSTYSMTFWLTGVPIGMLDTAAADERIKWFGALLDRLDPTTSNIHRLSWRTQYLRSEPVDMDAVVRGLRTGPEVRGGLGVMEELIAQLSSDAPHPITTMTLTLHAPSVKRAAQQSGSVEELLFQEVTSFVTSFSNTRNGLRGAALLTPSQLVELNELLLDSVSVQRSGRSLFVPRTGQPQLSLQGVTNRFFDFRPADHFMYGKTCHHGYLLDAPDRGAAVLTDFGVLSELSEVPKTVTTVMSVIPRSKALRATQIRAAAAKSAVAGIDEDHSYVGGATAALARQTAEQDSELANSRARMSRQVTYVDVFGPPGLSTAYARQFEAGMAQHSDLTVAPLDGVQETGFQALWTAGRGLSSVSYKTLIS